MTGQLPRRTEANAAKSGLGQASYDKRKRSRDSTSEPLMNANNPLLL